MKKLLLILVVLVFFVNGCVNVNVFSGKLNSFDDYTKEDADSLIPVHAVWYSTLEFHNQATKILEEPEKVLEMLESSIVEPTNCKLDNAIVFSFNDTRNKAKRISYVLRFGFHGRRAIYKLGEEIYSNSEMYECLAPLIPEDRNEEFENQKMMNYMSP